MSNPVQPDPSPSSLGPRPSTPEKPGVSAGGIIVVIVGVLVVLGLGTIVVSSMASTATREHQGPEGMIEALCAEPESAEVDDLCPADDNRGVVKPEFAQASPTPAGPAADLLVDELPAGPGLAVAYVDRYRSLLASDQPARLVAEVHLNGFAGADIAALTEKIHACKAEAGVEIVPGRARTIESDTTHTRLAIRVTERAPSCVTGAAVDGPTDLELDFVTANTVKSRHVWLLSSLHAKPASPGKTLFTPAAS